MKKLADAHNHKMEMLKDRLKEANMKVSASQKSYDRIEAKNRNIMNQSLRRMEYVKLTTTPPSKFLSTEEDEKSFRVRM